MAILLRTSLALILLLLQRSPVEGTLHFGFSRQISHDDDCFENAKVPVTTSSCNSILDDPTFLVERHSQCRSLCEEILPTFLKASRLDANCSFCERSSSLNSSQFGDDFRHFCIPRHECIEQCGPEQDGCIYTGSCASQICFSGEDSDEPAQVLRYTHHGPGTILAVSDPSDSANGSILSTSDTNPSKPPPSVTEGGDPCLGEDVLFRISSDCLSEEFSLSDSRQDSLGPQQCRTVCNTFNYDSYEVVRFFLGRSCDFCDKPESASWFTNLNTSNVQVCIPRSVCIENCGAEGYGCVYSGSCRSRICFSGIDSKKPALFTTLNDEGSTNMIEIDNTGPPVDADPPIFTYLNGVEGSATAVPPEGRFPATSAPPVSTPAPDDPPSPATQESGTSIGVWLGPTIGGVVLLAAIVVISMVMVRRKRGFVTGNGFHREKVADLKTQYPHYGRPNVYAMEAPTSSLTTGPSAMPPLTTPPNIA